MRWIFCDKVQADERPVREWLHMQFSQRTGNMQFWKTALQSQAKKLLV